MKWYNSEMEPVWIFDDRYRYRSKKDRPDRTGRSTGSTGLPVTGRSTGHDRSTGDRPVYRQTGRSKNFPNNYSIFG